MSVESGTGRRGVFGLVDVGVVLLLVLLGNAVFWLTPGAPIRVGAALVLLFVLPGYALTTAVFPARAPGRTTERGFAARATGLLDRELEEPAAAALTDGERLALAFGLSVALTPLFGLVAQLLAGGIRLVPLGLLVDGFVLLSLAVGVVRRRSVPVEHRYTVSVAGGRDRLGSFVSPGSDGPDVLSVALVVVILVSLGSFSFALVAPQQGATYTELSVLSSTESGTYESINYPTEMSLGANETLKTVVENHEARAVNYTLVIAFQRLDGDGVATVRSSSTASKRVDAGGTWEFEHQVQAQLDGEDLQVAYYLYRGSPPADVSQETAYRYVSFRTTVGDGAS